MSDRTGDLEFKLQHIVIAVKDITTEWYDLGLQLGLKDSVLKLIRSDHDTGGHLRMMLSKWLDTDTEASWDKLANALSKIGKDVVAAAIRNKYLRATTNQVDDTVIEDKTCMSLAN